jgi:phthalate 4,5-dioxygenase reductase component
MLLRIRSITYLAERINGYELMDREGSELPPFEAGAHISVRLGDGLVRDFSLWNDPAERARYCIAVLREPEGRGSREWHEVARVGEIVEASTPRNNFPLAGEAECHLLIAGGIGITPILAMIRTLRKMEGKQFKLYYCTRSPEFTAFRDELAAPELASSVVIHHDDGDPKRALDLKPLLAERKNRAHLYCCGPLGLMHAVRDMTSHWTSTSVHMEAFAEPERVKTGDKPFTVRLARSGETIPVPVGVTILEALRAAGHEVPSSCETGTCGTCRTKTLAGVADHRDLCLAEHEKADHIMICVSRAKSDEITVDR